MQNDATPTVGDMAPELRARVVQVLRETGGIGDVDRISVLHRAGSRNCVWRCSVRDESGRANRCVVVKQIGGRHWSRRQAGLRFENERAFLVAAGRSDAGPAVTPALLATVDEACTLIMEDLGESGCGEQWTPATLIAMAEALGRVQRIGVDDGLATGFRRRLGALRSVVRALHTLGLSGARSVINRLLALAHDSPSIRRCHGDPVISNLFCGSSSHARLVDFEFAEAAPALRDISTFYLAMPTASSPSSVRPDVLEHMRAAFEAAAGRCAQHDTSARGMAGSCAYWLLLTLKAHLPGAIAQDVVWGTASNRQRVMTRLRLFNQVAKEGAPAAAAESGAMLDVVLDRWGELPKLPEVPDSSRAAQEVPDVERV